MVARYGCGEDEDGYFLIVNRKNDLQTRGCRGFGGTSVAARRPLGCADSVIVHGDMAAPSSGRQLSPSTWRANTHNLLDHPTGNQPLSVGSIAR
jgi:hypothetical protein